MAELLTPDQEKFAGTFSRETGLDPRVVGAWLKAEQSGSAAKYYEDKGYNDWLNIANTDAGPAQGARSEVWSNPESAAKASAEWMKGSGRIAKEYGVPAEGIRNILKSRGQEAEDQIKAISNSGWASSGYNNGNTLRELYGELSGHQLALMSSVQRQANAKAGIAPIIPETSPQETEVEREAKNPINAITSVNTGATPTEGSIPGATENILEPGSAEATTQKNWESLKELYDQESPISSVATGKAPQLALPGEETGADRALKWATQHLGKFKENQGPNLGPELDKLEGEFRMTGEPWCAIFATTVAMQGGMNKTGRTASVAEINQWAEEGTHGYSKGLKSSDEARPGDLLTFGDQHVAVVKEVKGNTIITIEGNADPRGEGVVQLTHLVGEGKIVRPHYGAK